MIHTKIVATLGPASAEPHVLGRMLQAGLDVCRLNFSHGDAHAHARTLAAVRQAAGGEPIAILGDLPGPKIRLGQVADEGGTGGMPVETGGELVIQREPIVGGNGRASTNYPGFVDDVQVGDRVLVEDGLLRFLVTDKTAGELRLACMSGGVLKTAKGVNLPTTKIRIPAMTEKDREWVDWAVDNDLDYLALSFVRQPEDLLQLRHRLRERHSGIHIIAKIEKAEAIQNIDAILDLADGLMVARGDLGVEVDLAQVPVLQKELIRRCQRAGKPAIVATQMLQSMIENSTPTRAEVSDVANAIYDCADAVMLSGETSVGKYPVEAVHIMNHIAEVTERHAAGRELCAHPTTGPDGVSEAVAHGVWQMVRDLGAKLVVVLSQTGGTARVFSTHRFAASILALSSSPRVLRQMNLHFGVRPMHLETPPNMRRLIEQVDRLVVEERCASAGERIVIVAGSALGTPLNMTGIVIHTVGQLEQP